MAVLRFSEFQSVNHNDPLELVFSNIIEDTMNLINKIMLPLFFTPVVAITNLFTKNGWLILVNCTISLANIASAIFGCIEGTITLFDFFISACVMGGCVFLAISNTPNFFPLIYNFSDVFFALNVISIAINAAVFLKDIVIFAVRSVFEFFGVQLNDAFQIKPLDRTNNLSLLNFIMIKLFGHDISDQNTSEDKKNEEIAQINSMLKILGHYIDEYNLSFLGAVRNKRKIDNVKKLLTAFYLGGNFNNVISFIELELEYKTQEIRNLDAATVKLETAVNSQDLQQYNEFMFRYFSEVISVHSLDHVQASFDICYQILKKQIQINMDKCARFHGALPESSKFKKPYQDFSQKIESKYKLNTKLSP